MDERDFLEESETRAFVEELIRRDSLHSTALGVAKFYVDNGRRALSPRQERVLGFYVLGEHTVEACDRCGCSIPMCEQIEALDSGYCAYCQYVWEKEMAA